MSRNTTLEERVPYRSWGAASDRKLKTFWKGAHRIIDLCMALAQYLRWSQSKNLGTQSWDTHEALKREYPRSQAGGIMMVPRNLQPLERVHHDVDESKLVALDLGANRWNYI